MPPHDHLFKSLFRALFRDLLHLVDAKLAACLPPEAEVEFLDKELIPDSPEDEHRVVDLLAAIPDPAGGFAFLVHVEIERKAPRHIGRRLWDYSIRLRGQHPEPSVSLVVFLRGGLPGVAWQFYSEETAGHEVARFRYLSFGLSRLPAEQLLARPEPLAWGLAALAKPGALGRARVKFEALRKIANAKLRQHQRFLLMNCVETYLHLKGRDAEEYASLAGAQESPEIRTMQMTWADKMEAQMETKLTAKLKPELTAKLRPEITAKLRPEIEAKLKPEIEAKLEAKMEAKLESKVADRLRSTVIRLLGQRFGTVPARLAKRLAAIRTVDELGAIADRILEVQSIEELGIGG